MKCNTVCLVIYFLWTSPSEVLFHSNTILSMILGHKAFYSFIMKSEHNIKKLLWIIKEKNKIRQSVAELTCKYSFWFAPYCTMSMLIHEFSILKCIVPPTVPSVLIQQKNGLNDKNAKCVDGCVNCCIMKLALVRAWVLYAKPYFSKMEAYSWKSNNSLYPFKHFTASK